VFLVFGSWFWFWFWFWFVFWESVLATLMGYWNWADLGGAMGKWEAKSFTGPLGFMAQHREVVHYFSLSSLVRRPRTRTATNLCTFLL